MKRTITKDEINKITGECKDREKAFFTVMRQSGLPPHTIKQLQIKHVEKILESNTPIPCKINVPHERTPTFIGQEAIKYLKKYLATRTNLTPESLLFTLYSNPNKEINTKNVSRAFKITAQDLAKTRKIKYEIKRGKPSELRLFSLIKFYRKNAKSYLTELKNSYTPKDDEFYRKLYEEKAMPLLDIETPDIYELQNRLKKIENLVLPKEYEYEYELSPEELKQIEQNRKEYQKYLREHPEERKKLGIQDKEREKWLEEHSKEMEQDLKLLALEAELGEIKETIEKIKETIQNLPFKTVPKA